jgi:hypothetical protein
MSLSLFLSALAVATLCDNRIPDHVRFPPLNKDWSTLMIEDVCAGQWLEFVSATAFKPSSSASSSAASVFASSSSTSSSYYAPSSSSSSASASAPTSRLFATAQVPLSVG